MRIFALPVLSILLCLAALPSVAQTVVADLSQNRVSITANFDGSEIVVFGAITPDVFESAPVDVIVTVSGPVGPVVVRKKGRRAGIWVNVESVEIDSAPSLYKVATTGPLEEILSHVEDLRHRISIPRAIRSVGAPADVEDAARFTDALIRIRERMGLYRVEEGAVSLKAGTLFRTTVALPSNLVEGAYTARVFLTRDGAVVASYINELNVEKVGLERWLFNLAHQQPLIYGILSLVIAIAAGWGASAWFRYIRS